MDRISAEHIVAFELQMTERLTQHFQLDLQTLVYDGTPTSSPTSISAPVGTRVAGSQQAKTGRP